MAVWSVSAIGARFGRASRCGLMECAKLFFGQNGLGASVLVGCGVCLISHY